MAKLETPSVRDLYDTFIADYEARTGQQQPLLKAAFVRKLAWPIAGIVVLCYRFGLWGYFQMFIETCDFDALRLYGYRVGVDYKDGSSTIAQVTLTAVTAANIPTGTVFSSPLGKTYRTTDITPVVSNTAVCVITATSSGSASLVQIGDTMTLANPLNGVPDSGLITDVTVEGEEPETTEEYRARVQARYRLAPQGGAPADYFLWSVEVDGIVDALVYLINPGTVIVYPVETGSGLAREPSTVKLQEVEASIRRSPDSDVDDRHPIQSDLSVIAPSFKSYNVAITGLGTFANTSQNRTDIRAAIVQYFDSRKPEIPALNYSAAGATISEAELGAAAVDVLNNSQSPGTFTDLQAETGAAPIAGTSILGTGELAVLGTLTINGTVVS